MEETVARFALKDLVEVAPRTHPGFNFAGGTARISKVHDERESDGGPLKDGSDSQTTKFTRAPTSSPKKFFFFAAADACYVRRGAATACAT